MEVSVKKKLERRDRTWRHGDRVRRIHLRQVHRNGEVDCICEQSTWFFAKRGVNRHNCRRRKSGAPKLGGGVCWKFDMPPRIRERIDGRRLCRQWMREI